MSDLDHGPMYCMGHNCGTTTAQHSPECTLETAIIQGWSTEATLAAAKAVFDARATLSPAHIEDGEEVEVVAWQDANYPERIITAEQKAYSEVRIGAPSTVVKPYTRALIDKSQHERIVAARASKAAVRVEDEREACERWIRQQIGMPAHIPMDWGLPFNRHTLEAWSARAALSSPHEQAELWAVHVEGPDDLYAAFSREDAERHASELNAIPTPDGISISAVVIPSPWGAVEHWQYLAEQEREHVESMRAALSAPPAADGMCNADNPASRCECREEFGHRVCAAPPAAAGTTSDQYRAELYDEVWQKARDMGYGNVTDALVELERIKAAPPASEQQRAVVMPEITGTAIVEVVNGVEGPSLYIGNEDGGYRLAGPKPWGGGRTIHKFTVKLSELVREAMDLAAPSQGGDV